MQINPNSYEAYDLLHKGILALAKAERQGFRVDTEYVTNKKNHLTRKIARLQSNFDQSEFFKDWQKTSTKNINPGSGDQLADYLYRVKGHKIMKTTKSGKGSTDIEALGLLGIPEISDLIQIKKLKKCRDTYLDAFDREQIQGQVHPFFNLHIARTYRSSSNAPNFQNIPVRDEESKKICRQALYPRIDHQLGELDFGQLEVRIAECHNHDPKLKYDILHGDMHTDMCKEIFKIDDFNKGDKTHKTLRSATKNGFVFPEFYGDYYKNCAESLCTTWGRLPQTRWKAGQGIPFEDGFLSDHLIKVGLTSYDKFTKHIQHIEDMFWNERYMVYSRWKDKLFARYQRDGFVDFKTGFRASGLMKKNDVINYPVQGSAFHCLLWCLIEITDILEQRGFKTRIIGQIHDSIILDIYPPELPQVTQLIKYVTTEALPKHFTWIDIPLEVDFELAGVNEPWAKKAEYSI